MLIQFIAIDALCQDNGEFDGPAPEWEFRYHPVTKSTVASGIVTIDVKLNGNDRYNFQPILERQPGYKATVFGKETKRVIPVSPGDKLVIKRPYAKNDRDSLNMTLAIRSATFIENGTYTGVQYELVSIAGLPAPQENDLVLFYTVKQYKGVMLFSYIERLKISLLNVSTKAIFSHDRSAYAGEDMEKVKFIIADLEESADFLKDKVGGVWVSDGRFANKTISQIFMEAGELDVTNFINYIVSNPRKYMGRAMKINELYADWIKAGEPKGNIKASLYDEFERWWPMQPIGIDLKTGKINGHDFAEAMNKFTTLFPFYDDEPEDLTRYREEKKPGLPESYDYDMVRNSLTYFPKQKALKIFLTAHQYLSEPSIYGLSYKELTALLGKPAKMIGTPANPKACIFDRPYGSLEVKFDIFDGTTVLAYLYTVKPLKVVQVEKD